MRAMVQATQMRTNATAERGRRLPSCSRSSGAVAAEFTEFNVVLNLCGPAVVRLANPENWTRSSYYKCVTSAGPTSSFFFLPFF